MTRQRIILCSLLALCISLVTFGCFKMQKPGTRSMLTASKRSEVSRLLSSYAKREHRVPTLAHDIHSALSILEDSKLIQVKFLSRNRTASGNWKYYYEMSQRGVVRKVILTLDSSEASP
jgi:hypothetical protein